MQEISVSSDEAVERVLGFTVTKLLLLLSMSLTYLVALQSACFGLNKVLILKAQKRN